MPLEVREIGIRLAVDDAQREDDGPEAEQGAPAGLSWADRNAIVDQCVRAVLDELRRGRER
jgi:hypothetical protein